MSNSPGTLYVVATPLGNLGDFSQRAVDTLKGVDFVLAEDTRVFSKLASQFNLQIRAHSFFDEVENSRSAGIVDKLLSGQSAALVSDAGTPLLSDPGYRLVRLCRQQNVPVVPIPGPSAVTAALSVAGLPTDRFIFVGFLPKTDHKRNLIFQQAYELDSTLVFFESPNRIVKSIKALAENFPASEVFIGRELTKLYEQSFYGNAVEVIELLKNSVLKGEFVCCVSFKSVSPAKPS